MVESVQTGGTVETGAGLTFVYFCLTPETYQQGFNTTLTDRVAAHTHTHTHAHTHTDLDAIQTHFLLSSRCVGRNVQCVQL